MAVAGGSKTVFLTLTPKLKQVLTFGFYKDVHQCFGRAKTQTSTKY